MEKYGPSYQLNISFKEEQRLNYEQYAVQPNDSEQVKELKRQILSLSAQLEMQKERASSLSGGTLLKSESIDLYQGEQLDFLLSILKQVKAKCSPDSRPYEIIDSLLSVNKPVGRGQEILDEINRIFKSGYPTEAGLSTLKSLGFTYVSSKKHPKLRFADKYTVVLSATPGDARSSKNTLSEINKCIAVGLKI